MSSSASSLIISGLWTHEAVPNRVRVAVRLRPRNAEELVADVDFADCVEIQPEVRLGSFL
jgi:kinesin family protein 5